MLKVIFILVGGRTLSGVVSVCNISKNLLEPIRFKKSRKLPYFDKKTALCMLIIYGCT